MKEFNTRKMVTLAVFATISLAIYVLESMLPTLVPIPGVKLGLANIVTLFVLKRMGAKEAGLVLLVRIVLGSIFAGQAVSFLYSLCGGVLCLLVMMIINRILKGQAIFVTSIFGAMAHNIGQILAAFFVLSVTGVLAYIPFLMISGVVTGLFTGLVCYYVDKYIK